MNRQAELELLLAGHGISDYRWIDPRTIVVAQWVRIKCLFGCGSYGRNASCPPNVPPVAECRQFFDDYSTGAMLHFQKAVDRPEDRHAWSKGVNQNLLKLERAVFMAGYPKAFMLLMDSCGLCEECSEVRSECKQPRLGRPSPESMAVDVFSTVRQWDYPIEVLTDYSQNMNRYAFLLVE